MNLGNPFHILELIAMGTGLLNLYLAARASTWNWLFGIVTVSLFFVVFMHAKLYADMGSQVIFLILQFYGLYFWLYGGKHHSRVSTSHASLANLLTAGCFFIFLFASFAYLLTYYTDSTTIYLDASTTALGLVAQWMMGRKWVENWLLWIIIDAISIKMYLLKQLYLTTILFTFMLIQSLYGYLLWKRLASKKIKNIRENSCDSDNKTDNFYHTYS